MVKAESSFFGRGWSFARLPSGPVPPARMKDSWFPEHKHQVVGGHRDAFGQGQGVVCGEGGEGVQVTEAPGGVAAFEVLVEGKVAGGGFDVALEEGAVEDQRRAG